MEQFVDAAVRGDAQRVLAVVEMPFLIVLNPRNYKVFTNREDLQRIFSRKIRKFGTPDHVRVPQVAFVLTIKEARKRFANRLPAPLLAELGKLFAEDDQAFFVRGRTRDGRLIGKWIAFVRFRNGKPTLGGIFGLIGCRDFRPQSPTPGDLERRQRVLVIRSTSFV